MILESCMLMASEVIENEQLHMVIVEPIGLLHCIKICLLSKTHKKSIILKSRRVLNAKILQCCRLMVETILF
jgi:hypothetical protein